MPKAYLVLSRHVDNAIGINVEGDLHLGDTAGGRGKADQVKLAQGSIVCGHLSLSLQHLDAHLRLVVRGRAEDLGLLGGDGGVPASVHVALSKPEMYMPAAPPSINRRC